MGRRGPPPKPTHLRLVEGDPGRKLSSRKHEPQPRRRAPRCPQWLSEEARKAWREIVPELQRIGVLTVIDGQALVRYCVAHARWVEAEEWIEENGLQVEIRTKKGTIAYGEAPYVGIADKYGKVANRLATEFGLTPASRTRIHAPPPSDDDDEAKRARRIFGD